VQERELFFVIPTYRLREVGETVEQYDDHFWRNGLLRAHRSFRRLQPGESGKYFLAAGAHLYSQSRLYYVGHVRRSSSSPI